MATAYMDPNLNNAFLAGAKSQLSTGGSDRTMAGSVDRVLKVFHYFETNVEHSFWSSNIRYGDATDVRVRSTFRLDFSLRVGGVDCVHGRDSLKTWAPKIFSRKAVHF